MSERHYTGEELREYLISRDEHIMRHVEWCAACAEDLAFTRELEAALRDPLVWEVVQELRQPLSVPAASLEAARVLEEEDRAAADLLARALASIGAFRELQIETSRRFQRPGVVRVLTRSAKATRDSKPKLAHLAATAATAVAKNAGVIRPVTVGAAWLERAIVEFLLGEYRASQRALANAELGFAQETVQPLWDLANVWLTHANLFSETERFEDALDYASRAAAIFLDYGDVGRYLNAELLRGTVLYYRQQYRESIDVFNAMLARTDVARDPLILARTLHNTANSLVGLGDFDSATDYYCRAMALWDQLGCHSEEARTLWLLATIDFARGEWQTAYEGLENARRRLAALGLSNDEALVRLELAEVLSLLGRSAEIPALLEGVVVRFASEGMTRKARLALAWLAEANQSLALRPDQIRRVRDYLAELPTRPSAIFDPPL